MTDATKVKEIIHKIANKIIEKYKPKKVILFGSYAYGEPTKESDIDFLIIKDTDLRPIDTNLPSFGYRRWLRRRLLNVQTVRLRRLLLAALVSC